jgi:hypothetical protein
VHYIDTDVAPEQPDGFYAEYRKFLDANRPMIAQPAHSNGWRNRGKSAHQVLHAREDCAARFTNIVEIGALYSERGYTWDISIEIRPFRACFCIFFLSFFGQCMVVYSAASRWAKGLAAFFLSFFLCYSCVISWLLLGHHVSNRVFFFSFQIPRYVLQTPEVFFLSSAQITTQHVALVSSYTPRPQVLSSR